MTIVDEAMARLRRDRPEMSRESEACVEQLIREVEEVTHNCTLVYVARVLAGIVEGKQSSLAGDVFSVLAPTAASAPAGSTVPSDP